MVSGTCTRWIINTKEYLCFRLEQIFCICTGNFRCQNDFWNCPLSLNSFSFLCWCSRIERAEKSWKAESAGWEASSEVMTSTTGGCGLTFTSAPHPTEEIIASFDRAILEPFLLSVHGLQELFISMNDWTDNVPLLKAKHQCHKALPIHKNYPVKHRLLLVLWMFVTNLQVHYRRLLGRSVKHNALR